MEINTQALINTISSELEDLPVNPESKLKWIRTWQRIEFFSNIDSVNPEANPALSSGLGKIKHFQESPAVKHSLKKLNQALGALAEVDKIEEAHREEIKQVLLLSIDNAMRTLELIQRRKLKAEESLASNKYLKLQTDWISEKKKYKEALDNSYKTFLAIDNEIECPNIHHFYQDRKNRIHYRNLKNKVSDTYEITDTATTVSAFWLELVKTANKLSDEFIETFSNVLSKVGRGSTVLGTVPAGIDLASELTKDDKSTKHKLQAAATFGLKVFGAIMSTLSFPVAMIITNVLMIVGFSRGSIVPYYKHHQNIKNKEKQVKDLEQHLLNIEQESELTQTEKYLLLNRLEKITSRKSYHQAEIKAAQYLILAGHKAPINDALANRPGLFLDLLNNQPLNSFLRYKSAEGHQLTHLNNELEKLHSETPEKRKSFYNGMLGVIAGALFFAGNPYCAFVGLGLLMTNAVVGLDQHYHLFDKLKNALSKQTETPPPSVEVPLASTKERNDSSYKLFNASGLSQKAKSQPEMATARASSDSNLNDKANEKVSSNCRAEAPFEYQPSPLSFSPTTLRPSH